MVRVQGTRASPPGRSIGAQGLPERRIEGGTCGGVGAGQWVAPGQLSQGGVPRLRARLSSLAVGLDERLQLLSTLLPVLETLRAQSFLIYGFM